MFLEFKGAKIYYSVVGEGEVTVLLHGFLESSEIWKDFLSEFSQYGTIISIDLPGHGRSGVISEIHSMELMAEAVYKVLETMGVKNANFIGHSMGGYVSLAFLEQHPEMVNDFMLLNSTPLEDDEEKKQVRERSVTLVNKNKAAYVSMAIKNLLSPKNSEKFELEIQELIENAKEFPTQGITAALEGMKIRTNRTEVLRNFEGNKIVISGKEDPLINYNNIRALTKEIGGRFFGLSGGHLSYIENREEFLKLCISSKK